MNEKILVVADEQDVCHVLKEALEYEAFQVTVSNSGEDALNCLQGSQYHVVMVDVRLGGSVSGVEVIHRCGKMAKKPVILVISATPKRLLDPIFNQQGISDLINGVLEKPSDLNPDTIATTVKKSLK